MKHRLAILKVRNFYTQIVAWSGREPAINLLHAIKWRDMEFFLEYGSEDRSIIINRQYVAVALAPGSIGDFGDDVLESLLVVTEVTGDGIVL